MNEHIQGFIDKKRPLEEPDSASNKRRRVDNDPSLGAANFEPDNYELECCICKTSFTGGGNNPHGYSVPYTDKKTGRHCVSTYH